MEGYKKSGLQLNIAGREEKSSIHQVILPVTFYAVALLAFESLLQIPFWLPTLILGEILVISGSFIKDDRRLVTGICCVVIAAVTALVIFVPWAKDGARLMCSQLFSVSEASNRYIYVQMAPLPEGAEALKSICIFRTLLAVFGAAVSLLSVRGHKLWAALVFAAAVGIEIYFGVVPDVWCNVALFLLLALVLLRRGGENRTSLNYAGLLAAAVLVCLVVGIAAPGVNKNIENYSEHLRDMMDKSAHSAASWAQQAADDLNLTRRESRLNEEAANGTTDETLNYRDYEKQTEVQQEISRPERINYLEIILMLLLVVAVIVIPFIPFYFLGSRRKKALANRALFDSSDCGEAICAMFRHIVSCLTAAGMPDKNEDYSALASGAEILLSTKYAESYKNAVPLWQEAEYSGHIMTDEQKHVVRELLKETERGVFMSADSKTRFKLKYIDCLIVSEENQ